MIGRNVLIMLLGVEGPVISRGTVSNDGCFLRAFWGRRSRCWVCRVGRGSVDLSRIAGDVIEKMEYRHHLHPSRWELPAALLNIYQHFNVFLKKMTNYKFAYGTHMTGSSPASWRRLQDLSGCLLQALLTHQPVSLYAPKCEKLCLGVVQGFPNLSWNLFFSCDKHYHLVFCVPGWVRAWVSCLIWCSLILRADGLYVIHFFFWQAFTENLLYVRCCSMPYWHFRCSRFLDKFITILQFLLQKTYLNFLNLYEWHQQSLPGTPD